MGSSMFQFYVDEDLKEKASIICEKLGIDLEIYVRICLAILIYIINKLYCFFSFTHIFHLRIIWFAPVITL